MIYIKLFVEFLKVGAFSFGGGYTSIPLIRDIVIGNNWLTYETYLDLVAIAESTPGPIMVNIATYVGCKQAGWFGGILALIASILPAFIILLLFAILFKHLSGNKKIDYMFNILRPAILGIIFASGIELLVKSISKLDNLLIFIKNLFYNVIRLTYIEDYKNLLILVIIIAIMNIYKKVLKKKIDSILLIVISSVLGIIFFI